MDEKIDELNKKNEIYFNLKQSEAIDAQDEFAESLTEQHDHYSFETNMDFKIQKSSPEDNLYLSIYFFIPKSLQINKHTYSKEKFYADLNDYVRFRTPHISLTGILNVDNKNSPLVKIKENLAELENGASNEEIIETTTYNLRLLGAIMKSGLRDQIKFFFKGYIGKMPIEDLSIEITQYLKEIEDLEQVMRQLSYKFLAVQIPQQVRECFSFVDEYLSLQIQDQLVKAFRFIQENSELSDLQEKLIKIIEYERNHRRNMNSNLIRSTTEENESYVYWESILKKYIQGILYLNVKEKDEKSKTLQVFYSITTGLAMFFSLYATLLIGQIFHQNTFPAIFALVIMYIFKEKIQDLMRSYSNRFLNIRFPDRKYEICDPKGNKKIGVVKEIMRFLDQSKILPEILNIRYSSNVSPASIEREGKPEIVIEYLKKLKLYSNEISNVQKPYSDIFDIIRFNIKNFIQYADDPLRDEFVWNVESKNIEKITCAKVYHLNLVFKLRSVSNNGKEIVIYKKVVVVMDQKGIKRVQELKFHL